MDRLHGRFGNKQNRSENNLVKNKSVGGIVLSATSWDYCANYVYDEESESYYCDVNLDEDEMEKFLTDSFQGGCPYYRLEDEYRTVRKQM